MFTSTNHHVSVKTHYIRTRDLLSGGENDLALMISDTAAADQREAHLGHRAFRNFIFLAAIFR